jgi:hypothetical protein
MKIQLVFELTKHIYTAEIKSNQINKIFIGFSCRIPPGMSYAAMIKNVLYFLIQ